MVRFAVPLIALANGAIYDTFMERGYRADLAAIEPSSKSARGKSAQPPAADEGMVDRLRDCRRLTHLHSTVISLRECRALIRHIALSAG